MKSRNTQPNDKIGLENAASGESNVEKEVFRFISGVSRNPVVTDEDATTFKRKGRVLKGAPREKLSSRFPRQAPVPEGTVGNADKMRREILQLSLFPDIYTKVKRVQHPGNTDFGEPHDQEC